MRQAIITKFLGPTAHRGARVKVYAQAGSEVFQWNDSLNVEENHRRAAEYFAKRWGWLDTRTMVGGAMPDGNGYCFVLIQL